MKYVMVILSGAADEPCEELGGRTPLEAARIPNLQRLAREGRLGEIQTVPDEVFPGTDVAAMSLLGYDPRRCYMGRGPLEAANAGIRLDPTEWVFCADFVTIEDEKMRDPTAGRLRSEEGRKFVHLLNQKVNVPGLRFVPGAGHRNILVWKVDEPIEVVCVPPQHVLDQPVASFLPSGRGAEVILDLMMRSRVYLAENEINHVRIDLGENPANMVWIWGGGRLPRLDPFPRRFHVTAGVIAAVPAVRGVVRLADLDLLEVAGMTGHLDSNLRGKGERTLEAMKLYDLVVVHVGAADAASLDGNVRGKVAALEAADALVVGPLLAAAEDRGEICIAVVSDVRASVKRRRHLGGSVPFVIFGKGVPASLARAEAFSEKAAEAGDLHIGSGFDFMEYYLRKL
ncbi:MAG: 2,3-bisphosphoglycerate-independent phosphoglycerate mutase [Planctomycetota bacterium]